jgi:tight adherence protein B
MKVNKSLQRKVLTSSSTITAAFLIATLFSHSLLISIAFGIFAAIFIFIAQQRGESKRNSAIHGACPELIDILISGVQSGLSLNESLVGLAVRGPDIFKREFHEFAESLYAQGDFNKALIEVKESLAHPSLDQIIEALVIARELGGSELLTILRLLGKFIRDDLAHLSAAAPWILLLLLSTQPATSQAFSTPTGVLILCVGLGLTALAYLWMNSLSRIPVPNRIFIELSEMAA